MIDANGKPLHLTWRYDRAEVIADGVVHGIGILLGIVGVTTLLVLAALKGRAHETAALSIYASGLVGMLAVSAAYNLWPISRTKWMLRRVDHSLIYILIAGTYTAFASRLPVGPSSMAVLALVWSIALVGVGMKLLLPGRFDRLAVVLYVAMGWSGVLMADVVVAALPASTLWLIAMGGLIYCAGIVFHFWESLRFQNAVWHSFVLVASVLFYSAVLDGVVLA